MSETLYDRLGGEAGIEAVVETFYDRVLADESLAQYFEDTDVEALREHQRQFLAAVTGGADSYDGQSMRAAHAHLDLTEDDFAAVAGHLDSALRAHDVDPSDREQVLTAVVDLETEILDR
ncbi:group 1 truncated hemoglobin [Halomicroarcula sp. F13]|uniref:Group 1 truncated hemoglobin n=1 Tax=Haloarcula rubra TaxID=2487747 RepID=A0AAW4PWT9_9EURY|nr:group 1 truncated hemoglobin [Halomicroarcula rubra]MBX0324584.1 group 1 truncated hemoglobin [Halomicroarcula rubra]